MISLGSSSVPYTIKSFAIRAMSSDPLIGKPQKIIGYDSDFLNSMEYVSFNSGECVKHTNKILPPWLSL